jgi:hypothetical protein
MLSILESQMRIVLEDLSNEQKDVQVTDELIDKYTEQFREALKKQTTPRSKDFKLRMSNIGRAPCQLQKEAAGAEKERMPYNHWIRMVIGDCVEILARMVLDLSEVEVGSDGDQVELDVNGTKISGTSDIDIVVDGKQKVYDIKSASPYAVRDKWKNGFDHFYANDEFGYVAQLYGYADSQNKEPGGWITVDKSSGEIIVLEVCASPEQERKIRSSREYLVDLIVNKRSFKKCFDVQDEFFSKKPTGRTVLHKTCGWCSYKLDCFPTAQRLPNPSSTSKNPPYKWYVAYENAER